ncbi:hypothetical protein J4Q44_G00337940 [Coregonus suidteri]|uniref:Envelope protein n=1 Tax=Coregonus suidteri TaxID=861788 RepID=A0AAN8L0D1_9TELE
MKVPLWEAKSPPGKGRNLSPWVRLGVSECAYICFLLVVELRRRFTLIKNGNNNLNLIIRAGPEVFCQHFTLAPYMYRDRQTYWQVTVCCNDMTDSSDTPSVLKTEDDLRTPQLFSVVITTAPRTPDEALLIATGISGYSNNWLLLTEQAANSTTDSCVVCMGARPLLRIIPAIITTTCVLPLMKNDNPDRNCSKWDKIYPVVSRSVAKPLFSSVVAKANFTCVNMSGLGISLGDMPPDWCGNTLPGYERFRSVSRADVWWWCGGATLFDRLPRNATGSCALITLILPVSVYPTSVDGLLSRIDDLGLGSMSPRVKRSSVFSTDDSTYIYAIGVQGGVPDEYKLVDQVSAGFESSICWWCTINKNVDRINYIHFNVQKLENWTQQGFEAVHGQLAATSLMAFQNRIAVDMLLAERGGVCAMFGEQCCTFIPNNTAADGSLTIALEGLRTLNGKMKDHSGVDTSMWDSWMDAFGKYKTFISSVLISIAVFVSILTLCGCCCIPCARTLINRIITTAIVPIHNDQAQMYPLLGNNDLELDDFESDYPPLCNVNGGPLDCPFGNPECLYGVVPGGGWACHDYKPDVVVVVE